MDTIELSDFDIKPSSSTYGVELLMNDKSKTGSSNSKKDSDAMSDINLDDINILEQELNDLSFTDTMNVNQSGNENIGIHTMFESDVKNNVSFDNLDDDMDLDKPALGKMSSKHNSATTSTWDGFQKFDDITTYRQSQHYFLFGFVFYVSNNFWIKFDKSQPCLTFQIIYEIKSN